MPRMRAALALIALALVLAPTPGAAAAPALGPLNVQLSDLPAGFQLFAEQRLNTAAAAAKADGVLAATYISAGVLRANDRLYNGGTAAAPMLVFSLVYLLQSAADAHQFYRRFVHRTPRGAVHEPGAFGDEGIDVYGTTTSNGTTVRINLAIFRRGAYLTWLGVQPVTTSFAAPQVIHLAMLVDRRIQRAR